MSRASVMLPPRHLLLGLWVFLLLHLDLAGALQIEPLDDAARAEEGVPDDILDLVDSLWGGVDLPGNASKGLDAWGHRIAVEAEDATDSTYKSRRNATNATQCDKARNMVLLSPFDAGSHLMLKSLELNYRNEMWRACSWGFPHVALDDPYSHCRVWKHGVEAAPGDQVGAQQLVDILEGQGLKVNNTVAVIMMRSPISQLTSWRKAPYNVQGCLGLQGPCRADVTWRSDGDKCKFAPNCFAPFDSVTDVYNHYMRLYQSVKESGMFADVVFVPYEDLVFTPREIIKVVSEAMCFEDRDTINVFDAPAKHHGQAHGRAEAVNKLKQRTYLHEVTAGDKRKFCGSLDRSAVVGLSEGSYTNHAVAYDYDCH